MEPVRRALAVLCACVLVLLLGSLSAQARPRSQRSGPAMEYLLYSRVLQNPIEQESNIPWGEDAILNPFTDCAWDLDDHTVSIAEGALRAGDVLAKTECVIASQSPYWMTINGVEGWYGWSLGWYGVQVRAETPDLSVEVCYQPEGRCFTASPVYDAAVSKWVYNSCTQAAFSPGDPMLSVIPGSNGGVGVVQAVTTTITNPTSRNARNVDSTLGAVGAAYIWRGYGGCVKDAPVTVDYPFQYTG